MKKQICDAAYDAGRDQKSVILGRKKSFHGLVTRSMPRVTLVTKSRELNYEIRSLSFLSERKKPKASELALGLRVKNARAYLRLDVVAQNFIAFAEEQFPACNDGMGPTRAAAAIGNFEASLFVKTGGLRRDQ